MQACNFFNHLFFFFYCYGDHRDLHKEGHSFPTRRSSDLYFRNFLLSIVERFSPTHELQVVDDDEIEPMLGLHATRLCPHFENRQPGTVVDENRRFREPTRRSSETVPVRCDQLPSPHGQRVNLAFRGQHSLHQLLRGHLEAEEQHLAPQLDADVLGYRERERCLAHARTAGNEDKVRGLKTRRLLVKLGDARGNTGDALLSLIQMLDVLERVVENLLERNRTPLKTTLGKGKNLALGVVDQGLDVLFGLERFRDELSRRLNELTERPHVADDLRVGDEVGGDRRLLDQERERGGPPDELELLRAAELLAERDEVDGLTPVEQAQHRRVHHAVGLRIEIGGPEYLDHARERLTAFQEEGAEDRAFGVQVVRRDPGRQVHRRAIRARR